eukprot:CAMPEP_0171503880 /NCGR_PEP_ID=MMETSP0958-20121227/11191_1 /TAXON_ID=87120 /ORGANISM="Aurantiochytrium limacinum, Strain ATCCMYA-1381" /LENGTH=46 /DNA_ID= /DNA_START= /DNA_END= /DNA_ORIENTATION=
MPIAIQMSLSASIQTHLEAKLGFCYSSCEDHAEYSENLPVGPGFMD